MKVIKKNQIIIFLFAVVLITAGYLNYNKTNKVGIETAGLIDSEQVAGIGDAQLVSSDPVDSNTISENNVNVKVENNNLNTNIKNEKDATIQTNTSPNQEYFENSRLDREKMYSQMLETYQKILESTSISEEQKTISQAEISKIQNTQNSIMIAENLIKNKNVNDVIIFVNDYSISVIVDAENLGDAEVAQIQNIVVREFNANAEDIHVSKK